MTETTLYGVEGPAWPILKGIERHTGTPLTDFSAALEAAHLAYPHPGTIDMSAHMLLVTTAA
ncbi:hypothetical protein ABZ565_33290 [Streptomyces sp. NPDC016469]|uniref:hypothetical protein n=1 Tax=Streptomyces sp. NPDC016469 TaxID=3157191 RepID=UPI0033D1DAE6